MAELAAIFNLPGAELGATDGVDVALFWLLVAATVWVMGVLSRRQFHSITQRTLKRERGRWPPAS